MAAADRCTKPGEIGALLRREGVYSSSLSTWRGQREAADLAALTPQRSGPKADPSRADALPIAQLTRDNLRLAEQPGQGVYGRPSLLPLRQLAGLGGVTAGERDDRVDAHGHGLELFLLVVGRRVVHEIEAGQGRFDVLFEIEHTLPVEILPSRTVWPGARCSMNSVKTPAS